MIRLKNNKINTTVLIFDTKCRGKNNRRGYVGQYTKSNNSLKIKCKYKPIYTQKLNEFLGYDIRKKRYKNYKEYLRSSDWKNKRKKILKKADYCCQICLTARATQVHHKTYERVYQEKDEDLIAVCRNCHKEQHNLLTDEDVEREATEMMAKDSGWNV